MSTLIMQIILKENIYLLKSLGINETLLVQQFPRHITVVYIYIYVSRSATITLIKYLIRDIL